jgi:hypothetical protein
MEADWEIEIGADAPVIDGAWEGFLDLRAEPARVAEIREAAQFPALAESLVRLNAESSPVWTAKCDVWPVEAIDADELDADGEAAATALGCYIDLLPADEAAFSTLNSCSEWSQRLCQRLRSRPLHQCRVDLIIRRAFFAPESAGLGLTTYLTGCGPDRSEATESLAGALAALTDSVLANGAAGFET